MDPVSAYLEYLREMSRKIAYRGTFLNVLHRKPKRSPDRYQNYDVPTSQDLMQRYLTGVEQDIRGQDGRTLFIGLGLLTGKLVSEGRAAVVAAPLYTVPVEIEALDGPGATLTAEPQWNSTSLNYDLVTAVIERTSVVDPDEIVGAHDMLDPATTTVITALENAVDAHVQSDGFSQRLTSPEFLRTSITQLCSEVPAFRSQVTPAEMTYRKENLRLLVDQSKLRWHNHRFYFVGSMPDSLSAYEALNELCAQLRSAK